MGLSAQLPRPHCTIMFLICLVRTDQFPEVKMPCPPASLSPVNVNVMPAHVSSFPGWVSAQREAGPCVFCRNWGRQAQAGGQAPGPRAGHTGGSFQLDTVVLLENTESGEPARWWLRNGRQRLGAFDLQRDQNMEAGLLADWQLRTTPGCLRLGSLFGTAVVS